MSKAGKATGGTPTGAKGKAEVRPKGKNLVETMREIKMRKDPLCGQMPKSEPKKK